MNEKIRINKYLSDIGVCSRREADRLTEAGRVTANGELVSTGMKILPDAEICIDGKPVKKQEKKILLLFHKPKGIVCSTKTAAERGNSNRISGLSGADLSHRTAG